MGSMEKLDPKRMKVVFVGRRTGVNMGIIDWLDEHYTFCAAFFIEEDWSSRKARMKEVRRRIKRLGVLRTLDELLFFGFYTLWHGKKEDQLWATQFTEQFRTKSTIDEPCYSCDNIHKGSWLKKIKEIDPDIILGTFTRTIFKPKLFKIPKFGMFILHEGITPEYRGLYTAGWALLHGEPEYVGYTLLRIDKGIDSGPILCQGSFPDAGKFGFYWRFVGHLALVHGLPDMKQALDALYLHDGTFDEVSQVGRISRNYSWIRFSDYLRLRWRTLLHRLSNRETTRRA